MTYKETISDLLKSGIVMKCLVVFKTISALIKREGKDLDTAGRNIDMDEECSFTYAYNAMLHCGMALMNSQGFRPKHANKHKNIVRFCDALLGSDYSSLINVYEYMRKSRNKFLYEPDEAPCTRKEAEDVVENAREFLSKITSLIKKDAAQQKFDF